MFDSGEEFPSIIVSPRTYFRKTCLDCCLFMTLGSYSLCLRHVTYFVPPSYGNHRVARVEDSDREFVDPTTPSWIKLRWTRAYFRRMPCEHNTGNSVDLMRVLIVLIDLIDCYMSVSRLVVDTFAFLPARGKVQGASSGCLVDD